MADLVMGGRFSWGSTTQLKFAPFGGNYMKLAGVLRQIPVAGVLAANTGVMINGVAGGNLAANTPYLVCITDVGGVLTMDFKTTLTHAPSQSAGNEGVEIPSTDITRSVIGMIRTDAGALFQDNPAQRYVSSWFNPVRRLLQGAAITPFTTASTGFVLLGTGNQVEWVAFDREMLDISCACNVNGPTAGYVATMSFYISPINVYTTEAAFAPGIANGVGGLFTRYCQQIVTVGEGYGIASPYVAAPSGASTTFGNTYTSGSPGAGRMWGHLT